MRLATWSAVWIAVVGAGLMVALAVDSERAVLGKVIAQSLAWLTWWVGGLVMWSRAGNRAYSETQGALTDLGGLRGLPARTIVRYETGALAWRIACSIGVPALGLALLALALSPALTWVLPRCVLCGAVTFYAALVGSCLSAVVHAARAASPRHARLLVLAIILVPYLAHLAWPPFANLPSALAWLAQSIAVLGA
jgi:hypothetical protein